MAQPRFSHLPRLGWKKWSAIVFAVFWLAWEIFLQPIWNINVERWAEGQGYDTQLRDADSISYWDQLMSGLISAVNFVTGDFGLGFVIGGLLFAFWDPLTRHLKWPPGEVALLQKPKQARTDAGSGPQGRDLIPKGIWLEGERHKDGVDLRLVITVYNRFASSIFIAPAGRGCSIANSEDTGTKAPGISSEIGPGKGQDIRFQMFRCYEPADQMKAWAALSLKFGRKFGAPIAVMDIEYDAIIENIPSNLCKFKIKELQHQLTVYEYRDI